MDVTSLQQQVSGRVVGGAPADPEVTQFHSGTASPEVYVRPDTIGDISAAVTWAAQHDLPIVVRGGGHSAWGGVAGGMTIDLAAFASVEVDRADECALARVGGGATWGTVADALGAQGLAISSGDTRSVGVGGLTLGGGIGLMVRAWGLACDQLVEVTVVTADGRVVVASASVEADLFWAIRGAGAGFGVVTEFVFRAHAVPAVVHTSVPVTNAADLLRAARDGFTGAPRELTATFMDVPPMDPSAPPGVSMTFIWAGDDHGASDAAVRAVLGALAPAELDSEVVAYSSVLEDVPAVDPEHPMPGFVGGNVLVADLSDDMIDQLVAFRKRWPGSVTFARSLGGAYSDVAEEGSAFDSRAATWFVMAGAFDVGLTDADRAEVTAAWRDIQDQGLTMYANFVSDTDPSLVVEIYTEPTRQRLRDLKRTWDPQNLFCRTHTVAPET